jgi:hypothetical protein
MAATILSAKYYPAIDRRVVRVVLNPDDPEAVHTHKLGPSGEVGLTDMVGQPLLDVDGVRRTKTVRQRVPLATPVKHTGEAPAGTPAGLKSWEWCNLCLYNWQEEEHVYDGTPVSRIEKVIGLGPIEFQEVV